VVGFQGVNACEEFYGTRQMVSNNTVALYIGSPDFVVLGESEPARIWIKVGVVKFLSFIYHGNMIKI
jgi:hypothetical protein